MSWDSYVDNLKARGCSDGFIIGQDGSAWTTESKCSPEELANIVRDMKALMYDTVTEKPSKLKVRGVEYLFLRTLDSMAYFKKKDHGGVAIYMSKTALVVGFYDEGMQAGKCNESVHVVGNYLENQNM